MNIGIDARNTGKKKTGIGTYVLKIIEELTKLDQENHYFLYSTEEIQLDFPIGTRFTVRENIGNKLKFYLSMPKMLEQDKIDVYWGTHYILPKKKGNRKYVLTIHDLSIKKLKTVGSFKTTMVQKLFLKKSINRADKIIAVSEATKNDILTFFKVPEEKIKMIYERSKCRERRDLPIRKAKKRNRRKIQNKKYSVFVFLKYDRA